MPDEIALQVLSDFDFSPKTWSHFETSFVDTVIYCAFATVSNKWEIGTVIINYQNVANWIVFLACTGKCSENGFRATDVEIYELVLQFLVKVGDITIEEQQELLSRKENLSNIDKVLLNALGNIVPPSGEKTKSNEPGDFVPPSGEKNK